MINFTGILEIAYRQHIIKRTCRGRSYIFSPTRDFCLIKLLPPELLEHSIPAYTTYPLSHSEDIGFNCKSDNTRLKPYDLAMHNPGKSEVDKSELNYMRLGLGLNILCSHSHMRCAYNTKLTNEN